MRFPIRPLYSNCGRISIGLDTIPACDRQTDRHLVTAYTRYAYASRNKKNYDNTLSRFHTIPNVTDGQTDRQTDGRTDGQICYIIMARHLPTRDKNYTESAEITDSGRLFQIFTTRILTGNSQVRPLQKIENGHEA